MAAILSIMHGRLRSQLVRAAFCGLREQCPAVRFYTDGDHSQQEPFHAIPGREPRWTSAADAVSLIKSGLVSLTYMYIIHTCTNSYMYIYIHVHYIHVQIHKCTYSYMYIFIHVNIHACKFRCMNQRSTAYLLLFLNSIYISFCKIYMDPFDEILSSLFLQEKMMSFNLIILFSE